MKTLYALIFACVSLQACNSQTETPTGSINTVAQSAFDRTAKSYDDDYAMWTTLPTAEFWMDTTIGDADDTAAMVPIDGAEFDGTSRDGSYAHWEMLPGGDDSNNTGSVNVVVPDYSLDIDGE